jgi:DNA replication and repair protein RecF
VRLVRLRLENLRAFQNLDLELAPSWSVFVGPNGAGKTTLLEAAYLLSHARSFRAAPREALVRHGTSGFSVFGRVARESATMSGLGLARVSGELEARVDGARVPVSELLREIAVVCFEPGSHELISGAADGRRRFLDWGVFHVEHDFLRLWRSYQRALRQRNALLRSGADGASLDPWDRELARSGAPLVAMRERYGARLGPIVTARLGEIVAELGPARFQLSGGWRNEVDALEKLAGSRPDDLRRGFTTQGPHRADWSIAFERAPRREHLSRGQEKLCALGCVLAQAELFAEWRGEWPIVCIDDLASELDAAHQEPLVRTLAGKDAQILVTGTHFPIAFEHLAEAPARFHVEPESVVRLL